MGSRVCHALGGGGTRAQGGGVEKPVAKTNSGMPRAQVSWGTNVGSRVSCACEAQASGWFKSYSPFFFNPKGSRPSRPASSVTTPRPGAKGRRNEGLPLVLQFLREI